VVIWPIRLILRLLAVPAGWMLQISRKTFKKAGRAGKSRLSRIKLWRRILKNKKKKI
jgi:hypothetical protein